MKAFDKRLTALKEYWHNGGNVTIITACTLLIISIYVLALVFPNAIKFRIGIVRDNMSKIAQEWNSSFLNFMNYSYRTGFTDARYLAHQDSCYNLCKDLCDYPLGGVIAASMCFKEGVFDENVPFMPYYCSLDSTKQDLFKESEEAANYLNSNDFRFSKDSGGNYFRNSNPFIPEQLKGSGICTYSFTLPINANGDNALVNIYYATDSILSDIENSYISENGKTFFIDGDNNIILHPDASMIGKSASEWMEDAYGNYIVEAYDSIFKCLEITHQDRNNVEVPVFSTSSLRHYIFACPIFSMNAAIVFIIDRKYILNQLGVDLIFKIILCLIILAFVIHWSNKLIVRSIKKDNEDKKTLEAELSSAAIIQNSMLSLPVQLEGIDISSMLIPAKTVGGDLYYSCVHNNKLYFCLGDVSGKGVPASIFMSRVITLFQILLPIYPTADQLISAINGYLCKGNDSLMFVTLFLGIFDPDTGKLEYCNAGHDSPLLCSEDKEKDSRLIERSACIPLGIDNTFNFSSSFLDFTVGSTLFIYSDGITEAMNDDGELFETRRMVEVIRHCCFKFDAKQINGQIIRSVQAFAGGQAQSDDITVMTIKRLS